MVVYENFFSFTFFLFEPRSKMTHLECAEDTDTDLAGFTVESDHLVGVDLTPYVLLHIRVYVTVRLGHLQHNTVQ